MDKTKLLNNANLEADVAKKSEKITSLVLKIFTLLLIILGFSFLFIDSKNNFLIQFSYLENIILAVFGVFLVANIVLDVLRLTLKKDFRNKFFYITKFSLVIDLFLIFSVFIVSVIVKGIQPSIADMRLDFTSVVTYLTYVIIPLIGTFEFLYSDYAFKSKRYYSYFALIAPTLYVILTISLSYVSDFPRIWQENGVNVPYFFLDYKEFSITGLYLNSANKVAIFCMSYAATVLLIGLVLLFLKNKRQIKKYSLDYLNFEGYHQDI